MSIAHEPHGKHARRQAVVVGAAGQDGRLLCAELEGDGYEVVRVERGGIRQADGAIDSLDIRDPRAWQRLFEKCSPSEIYYLAAHHHSSEEGQGDLVQLLNESFAVHVFGLMGVLDQIVRMQSRARLFYASSSLIFGEADHAPQSETTPIRPICAYGVTKAAGMGL